MTQDYTVKLNIFEGPLDLLLHLIKANELEVSEISISAITGQYLDALRLMESLDLDIAGDFLVMASTLLNIKLRALLPAPDAEEEEEPEDGGGDFLSARALMQQLVEYRKFKEAAQDLGNRADRQAQIFLREVALPKLIEAENDPAITGDLGRLLDAFSRVLLFVQRRDFHQVQQDEFDIGDKIDLLRRRMFVEDQFSLTVLLGQCRAKLEMIVTVIAVLELCRLKELRIAQTDSFGDIYLYRADGTGKVEDAEGEANEAEELARIEADILANRTGFIDDGQLPEDDEDALLARVLGEAATESSGEASNLEPPAEDFMKQPPPVVRNVDCAGADSEQAGGDDDFGDDDSGDENRARSGGARIIELNESASESKEGDERP